MDVWGEAAAQGFVVIEGAGVVDQFVFPAADQFMGWLACWGKVEGLDAVRVEG